MRAPTRFKGPAPLTNAAANMYVVPASSLAVLRQIHVSNPTGNAVGLTLSIGADAAGTRLYDSYSIPAAAAGVIASVMDFFCYHPVAAGEVVQAFCATQNALVIEISGDLITLG